MAPRRTGPLPLLVTMAEALFARRLKYHGQVHRRGRGLLGIVRVVAREAELGEDRHRAEFS